MTERITRVAVAQLRSGTDVDANRASMVSLVDQAASAGADLVAFPEYATYLGPDSGFAAAAEPIENGRTTSLLGELAREHRLSILLGSMVEQGDDGLLYNTSVLMSAAGDIISTYRKIHLFHSTLPGASGSESDRITPGRSVAVARWGSWTVGMSICFDVRFPELYRELAALHADIITVPAAFTAYTGKDHWEVLLRARAIENQAYVIAPAQIGAFEGGESYGRSCVIDPWGTVLAVVADSAGTGIAVAALDADRVVQVRTTLPALANRRFGRTELPNAQLSSGRPVSAPEQEQSCIGY